MYHPYVRPPTVDIIARVYPNKNGERTKVYPSGATLRGTVVNEVFKVGGWVSGWVVYSLKKNSLGISFQSFSWFALQPM